MEKLELPQSLLDMSNSTKDDYIQDGLLYCGICHTKKQTKIMLGDAERIVGCNCKCKQEAFEREREEIRQRERLDRVKKLRLNSLMGERYANATFDTCILDNPSFRIAYNRCRKYCDNSSEVLENGYGVYLWGSCGTGKTHLMACMVNELTSQLKQCLFTNFFEISKSIRATFNTRNETEERLINSIADVDFLFIDDLGTERLQSNGADTWLQEKIYDIINKRYNAKKPTVFTSNYNLSELIKERGMMTKTVDRIVEMSNAVIRIEGASYRTKLTKQIPF